MNFLSAIKHAVIGYGIRRTEWNPKAVLSLNSECKLEWLEPKNGDNECKMLGEDRSMDLTDIDITSEDWEVI